MFRWPLWLKTLVDEKVKVDFCSAKTSTSSHSMLAVIAAFAALSVQLGGAEIVELSEVSVNQTALEILKHLETLQQSAESNETSSARNLGETCWIARHRLWDCGLHCYRSSTWNWKPCASTCVQFQHLSSRCNRCLSDLVSCVLLQCVSPCARSTHTASCEGCILGGCDNKCWNPWHGQHFEIWGNFSVQKGWRWCSNLYSMNVQYPLPLRQLLELNWLTYADMRPAASLMPELKMVSLCVQTVFGQWIKFIFMKQWDPTSRGEPPNALGLVDQQF